MRVLYLMHIDWGWIKQRPHFIAEHLAKRHDVLVAYRVNPSRRRLSDNRSDVRRLPLLPVPRRWGLWSERLDVFLQRVWLSIIILFFRPDVVWVTFPTLFSYLTRRMRNMRIVYDCMDDACCFYKDPAVAERVARLEGRLVDASARVFCSSQTLCERLAERCGNAKKITLVRNGISDDMVDQVTDSIKTEEAEEKQTTDLAYCGTISDWFDFPSVISALDRLPGLRLHLIGPVDCEIPDHKRIIRHGVVDRVRLREFVQPFDAFVMPFVVNPLIEGVDPVKLYEYISFGKQTVCVFYKEIERFGPYVHFYSSGEEFLGLMERLVNGGLEKKAGSDEVLSFLKDNTWSRRGEQVEEMLSV